MTLAPMPNNDRQAQFVSLVVQGYSIRAAAREAGYAEAGGTKLAQQPHVKAAIMARVQNRLQTIHAPMAVEIVAKIMRDPDGLPANRLKAAQLLIDRAGLVPPKAAEPEQANTKDAAEMTTREIEEFVAKAQAQLAQRQAQTIDITPQEPDILD